MARSPRLLGKLVPLLAVSALSCGSATEDTAGDPSRAGGTSQQVASEETQRVPVEALVLRKRRIQETVVLTGVLRPRREVEIVAEVQGQVASIHTELGSAVSPSDTLARIGDTIPLSQYRQAQARVLTADNNLDIAQLNYGSDKELLKNGDISQLAYENSLLAVKAAEADRLSALASLDIAEKQFVDTRVTAPFAGLIARRYVDPGAMVSPGTPIFREIDLSVLKLEVGLAQSSVSRVRVGNPASVRVSALAGTAYEGVVHTVAPQADEQSGTFAVEIHVRNTPDRILRAGMTARADLFLRGAGQQLAVPDYALVTRNGGRYVYRIEGGSAHLKEVSVSEILGGQAVIQSGLAPGDTVVVVGMKNLGVDTKVWVETVHDDGG